MARIDGSGIELTSDGRELAAAGILTGRQLLARHAPRPRDHPEGSE